MNFKNANAFYVPILAAIATIATGCAGPDMVMPNPITAGVVAPNHIVKPHGFAESRSGLPSGSMSDEAIIEQADKQQVCINVSLHELAAIDLTSAEVKVSSSTGAIVQPQLNAEAPSSQTFQGLVPHEERTGTRQVCRYENGQSICETQPIIQTTMIPGPVEVFNTKGRMCAPNQNLLVATTKDMEIKITMPTSERSAWGFGHANKSMTFRWAFQ